MIYAYMGRNGKLFLRPADPEGEEELKDFLHQYKQNGLEAVDIETEMPDDEYRSYQQEKQRSYNRGNTQSFGFIPQSNRYPMPPDFSPQAHYYPPFILPIWLNQGGGSGGDGGRSGGGDSGGRGAENLGDSIIRSERGGDYDGRGGNENPRDTGRRDIPRR